MSIETTLIALSICSAIIIAVGAYLLARYWNAKKQPDSAKM